MDEEDDFKISENNINNNSNEIDFKIEEIDNNLMTSTSEFQSSLRPTKLSQRINNEEGPINLIEFSKKNFLLKEEALNILRNIKEELIVVSIVGKARTGKSFLMNLLLNSNNNQNVNNGFKIGSSINSCTRGIWIWNTPKETPNSKSKILFIDSEGTNSVDISTKTYDSKIFALIVLISSLFIYNTNGNIDEKSISELALAAHLSNSIATNSKIDKDILIEELAPKFIWTLRDFTLDKIDPETNEEISSNEYLELCLRNKISGKNSNENNLIRQNILKYFKDRECITLPRPVDSEENLQNLDKIPFNQLKTNFRKEFLVLKEKVYYTSKPKVINRKRINGAILADLLIAFVDSINSGIIPNINTAWDNIIINDIDDYYNNSLRYFKQNVSKCKDIRTLYKLKFNTMMNYQNVLIQNKEILENEKYKDKYNKCLNDIEREIDFQIMNKIKEIKNDNIKQVKDVITNKIKILDSNLFKESYKSDNNYDNLIKDYIDFLNSAKETDKISDKETLNIIFKSDLSETKDILYFLITQKKSEYNKDKLSIDKELSKNQLIIENNNAAPIIELNKSLQQQINLLNKDKSKKDKEIEELVEKYKSLMDKRDDLKEKRQTQFIRSLRKSNLPENRLTKSGKKFYTDLEGEEKGCSCQVKEVCFVF